MIQRFVIFVIFLLFILLTGYLAYNYSQTERFGDEIAHFIGGHFFLQGKRLYQDMQFNHLPLPYLFSGITEFISQPKNLYLYIARQREAIFIYSAVWCIIYFFTFGKIFLIYIVIFEVIKYFFQGYKLLNETIAVYPLVFMMGIITELYLYKKIPSRIALIIFSIASFIAVFSLLPLWIVIAIFYLILFSSLRRKKHLWKYAIIPNLILTVILFLIVSFPHMIKEAVINNVIYFLPNSGRNFSFLKMIFLPFASLFPPYHPSKLTVGSFVIFTVISFFLSRNLWKKYLFIIFLLMLINFFRVDDYAFTNFHLLPWVGALMVIEILWLKNTKNKYRFYKFIALFLLIIYLFFTAGKNLYTKRNLANDFYINYSESESYGSAINILKNKNDKLLVIPNDPLIYYVSKMTLPTRVLEYYPWVYHIPEDKEELNNLIDKNPPEFIVDTGLNKDNQLEKKILSNLKTKYMRIYHANNPSKLYVSLSKTNTITNNQWKNLKKFLYTKNQYE